MPVRPDVPQARVIRPATAVRRRGRAPLRSAVAALLAGALGLALCRYGSGGSPDRDVRGDVRRHGLHGARRSVRVDRR
ncbi:hypothetical protein ABZX77_34285 [Streptomyces sp. NPDC004237]|uniref:hypothetical protein n=1 Tax=Streptomyces sp. NPDC004237 TaxID=3154455 RepID=UPI0033B96307